MRERKIFSTLILIIIFCLILSTNAKATETPVYSSVSIDKVMKMINDNTFIQPVEVYKNSNNNEFNVTINVQDGGLRNQFKYNERNIISYVYHKSVGNPINGADGVNGVGNVEITVDYHIGANWNTVVKKTSEDYNGKSQSVSIGNRKAVYFSHFNDKDNNYTIGQNTPGYTKDSSVKEEWLIQLPELNNDSEDVYIRVKSSYSSKVIGTGDNIAGYKDLHDSYMNEYKQALKSIVASVRVQVSGSEFDKTVGKSSKDNKEKDSNKANWANIVKVVIGTAVLGIGIILIGPLVGRKMSSSPSPTVGSTGTRDGTERVLKGKTDGREYNIKYNAEKDEWTNTETGNIFIPERFEGWQEDLAKDWEQSSKEREKMSNRDTEFDKDIKRSIEKDNENAELLKKLHHLRRNLNLHRTEAGRINRPPGEPGSMTDKINELEKQLINGEAVDKELLRKVQRVYTKASNGDITGYNDLPNNSLGKEIGNAIELTGKEIFSGSSKKALVLRGLMAVASGGATEMGMEIASAGFVIKDYVDKGGDSVVEGVILSTGNVIISEGAGRVTGKAIKFVSKKGSKIITKATKSSEKTREFIEKIDSARNAKFNYKNMEIEVGLNDKMIKRMINEGGETFKNIYVAPPFQDIYKSMLN